MRRRLVAGPLFALCACLLAPGSAWALNAGATTLVSRPSDGQPLPSGLVNDASIEEHAVSQDGRYVAFASGSDGLLALPSRFRQVFRLDRLTNELRLVSATAAGNPGNGDSASASISDDGSRVAYTSRASDLAATATNQSEDIFVRDLDAFGTQSELVSRASALSGGAAANSQSLLPVVAGDGLSVLFSSYATNLSADDVSGQRSTYVRTITGVRTTLLISRADGAAGASAAQDAYGTALSADGDVVLFVTATGALSATADGNGTTDVYARRLSTDDTVLVSRATDGADEVGDGSSFNGVLSASGATAAFASLATNLVTTADTNGKSDIFRRTSVFGDAAGTTTLISRTPAVTVEEADDDSTRPAISDDGSTIAFASEATDLLSQPDGNGRGDAFVRDGSTTSLLSRTPAGAPASGAKPFETPDVALAGDGSVAVFSSSANDLSALDDDSFTGVYAAGVAGSITSLARPPGLAGPFVGGVEPAGLGPGAISADGRYVAFTSRSDVLAPDDDDDRQNGFLRDLLTGATTLVSGAGANGDVGAIEISADGGTVAFSSSATNLSPDDGDATSDVYVRDLRSGALTLISRASGAGPKGDNESYVGSVSADGSRVAFVSGATTLGAGTDPDDDVFVRDLRSGALLLASRGDGPDGDQANANARDGSISADGTRVAFSSSATNLADGDADATSDVHVRDLAAGRTLLVSRADGDGGVKGDFGSDTADISADGAHVAFVTQATNFGDGDTPGLSVFVRDLAARTTRLASRADGAGGAPVGNGFLGPRISGDGTRVLFTMSPGDVTGEAPADTAQTFLRDLATARTTLVSRGDGAAGPPLPATPFYTFSAISDSGNCVAFVGAPGPGFTSPEYPTSDFFQVYLRTVDGTCAPAPAAAPVGAAADRSRPVLSRVRLSPSRFAVAPRSTPARASARKRKKPARGTTLRFTLSEPASVRVSIARAQTGARKGRGCVKRTAKLKRARRCTRYVTAGTLTRTRRPKGASRVAFSGRIGRKALRPGRHRATLVATDPAGNRSAARVAAFTVVRGS